MIDIITSLVLPFVLCIAAMGFLSKSEALKAFTEGAYDGMKCCMELLPSMLLIMCCVNALFSSGLADILCTLFSPLLTMVKVPQEMIPTVILRPFSGSAATALADKLFSQHGADSVASKTACLLMGSTDTVLYTLGMYFGAVKIKKTRYAIPASLIVFVFSVVLCSFLGNAIYK